MASTCTSIAAGDDLSVRRRQTDGAGPKVVLSSCVNRVEVVMWSFGVWKPRQHKGTEDWRLKVTRPRPVR
jgi:hypothetical protein